MDIFNRTISFSAKTVDQNFTGFDTGNYKIGVWSITNPGAGPQNRLGVCSMPPPVPRSRGAVRSRQFP